MHLLALLRAAWLVLSIRGACAAGSAAAAGSYGAEVEEFCVDACTSSVNSVNYADADGKGAFPKVCHSHFAAWSLLLCARVYCGLDETRAQPHLNELNRTCTTTGTPLPSIGAVAAYPDKKLEAISRVTAENRTRLDVFDEVAIPSDGFLKQWIDTLSATEYVYYYHNAYGWAMGVYWAVIVAIGAIARSWQWFETRKRGSRRESRLTAWYKSRVSVPMAFGSTYPRDAGWATVPPRDQALAAAAFVVLNVWLSSVGYRIIDGNLYYPSRVNQVLRYVSDRTGIISFANFPLIWLFGTRNNVVSWVTGWDFPTCTNFHRWVARVAAVQAVIHSIGYTILVLRVGGWDQFAMWWTYTFWWAGELATIFMCALVALSFYWVRKRHYETFLVSHIVLSVLVLVTMLLHVAIFNGAYDALVIVPVCIWVADRVLRTLRIVLFNPKFWTTRASTSYDEAANLVRMEVPLSKRLYKFRPGTYCYLMVLHDRTWWQSHPFTIASVKSSVSDKETTEESEEQGPLLQLRSSYELADAAVDAVPDETRSDVATILIRPYDQFTGRLRDLASEKGEAASLRVVIEGPYGQTRPLDRFDKVVFITGGSGIAVPLSYLDMLLKKNERSRTMSVEVHWAVRESSFAALALREDLRVYLKDQRFTVSTYLKETPGHLETVWTDFEAKGDNVRLKRGRLNCAEQIAKVVEDVESEGGGSLALVCCGPAGMADDCRAAVTRLLGPGSARLEYFEESYNW